MQNKLIDKYVYNVIKRLPVKDRVEVEKELRANIEDMLCDDYSKENIEKVILELGDPRKLAVSYMPSRKPFIASEYLYDYLNVLKIVLMIVGIVVPIIAIMNNIFSMGEKDLLELYKATASDAVGSTVTSLYAAFTWVTLVFYFIGKVNKNEVFKLEQLTDVPAKKKGNRISIAETVVEMVFSLIFTTIIIVQPNILMFIRVSSDKISNVPLFIADNLVKFIPFIIALYLLELALSIVKLVVGRWTNIVAAINAFVKVISNATTVFILVFGNIFNPAIITSLEELIGRSIDIKWGQFSQVVVLIFVIITVVDVISAFAKANKRIIEE